MHPEEKYALGLLVLSLVVIGTGWLLARRFATAPGGMIRVAFPIAATVSLLAYAVFVAIARAHVHG